MLLAAGAQAPATQGVVLRGIGLETADAAIAGEHLGARFAIDYRSAPALSPKTWYGMPAYANADGKVVCFFQPASKFGARYASFGFNDAARLDDGAMWPVVFALKSLNAADEKKVAALVKRAAG